MSWPSFWVQKNWKSLLLQPLACLTCWVARRRLQQFRLHPPQKISPAKIIVVGNIVVGGSGKTPFIIWLASVLSQHNLRYGIVSRGYGGKSKVWPQRVNANSDAKLVGDEPVLLAKKLACPIAVSPKRTEAIAALAHENLDVIIADDGLQHFAMARDVEVVMIDAARGLGNALCMPAGPLREPASRMESVDFVVYNGGDSQTWTMALQPVCFRLVKDPSQSCALDSFAGQSVTAVAGIGNPERFFDTLKQLKVQTHKLAFADHQAYSEQDFSGINPNLAMLMTEKDAVKCQTFAQPNWWYLEVQPSCSKGLAEAIMQSLQ